MTVSFPRTLVVSTTRFDTVTATGSALLGLFAEWPGVALAQVHAQGGDIEPTLCTRYYRFDETADSADLSPGLLSFVKSFKPDVIYYRTIDTPPGFRTLASRLHQALGIPVVTHTMDDWLARLRETGDSTDASIAYEELRDVVGLASANLAISDSMAKSMETTYGRAFDTFHNSIDTAEWASFTRQRSVDSDHVFRVRYTGSLASDMCLQSVKDLARVVDHLSREGRSIRLEFCSAPWWKTVYDEELAGQYRGLHHVGALSRSEYLQFVGDADLAVLPINFDELSLSYIRHSMSNKAPDYMAAALPVLAYGPAESATIAYAKSAGWAHVVKSQSLNDLADALRLLMDSPARRTSLAARSASIGRAAHNREEHARRFQAVLRRAAEFQVA